MAKGSYHVLMGSRSPEKGNAALKELQSRNLAGSVEMIQLDVTDDDTIERAAATVQRNHGKLDMLVNNAAVAAMTPPLRQQMRVAFDTNATGPAVVTSLFAPLLQKSTASPRIVNISSGVGSINRRLNPDSPTYKLQGVQYRASKTALSMVTACQWVEYEPLGIKVFAYDPGFTQSNLGPHNKAENGAKPASEAVMPLIDVLEGKRDHEAGKFLHNTGVYPW
jgi:NAD(P)-dependent dehydrogenase (short-subunit alcohol dehydrogenase family)